MGTIRSATGVMCAALFIAVLSLAHQSSAADRDAAMLQRARQLFGSLPQVMGSPQNPVTPEKVSLGKLLFYESRISVDGTVSCVRCHPFSLYAADGLRKPIGNRCAVNPRNAPTVLNAAAQIAAHWIGNRKDVEDQAKQALVGPPSFGMPSYQAVEQKLKQIEGYTALFKRAFPEEKEPVTVDNFAKAVGAFERTLLTPAPFDAFLKGNGKALTDRQKAGLSTFMEVGCGGCHSSPYMGGQTYQKFGATEPYWQQTRSSPVDEGRYAVTKNEADKYVFKVPVLRNVEMTSPYFHDGSVDKLQEAIRIMGKVQLARDLSNQQVGDVAQFLQSLTGKIPDSVLTVPVLPSMQ